LVGLIGQIVSELKYYLPLARDLIFLSKSSCNKPSSQGIKVKRRLSGKILKLKADR
jgi:hypothetical protein